MINIKLHHSKLRCPGSVRASKGADEAGGREREERERERENSLCKREEGGKEGGREKERPRSARPQWPCEGGKAV